MKLKAELGSRELEHPNTKYPGNPAKWVTFNRLLLFPRPLRHCSWPCHCLSVSILLPELCCCFFTLLLNLVHWLQVVPCRQTITHGFFCKDIRGWKCMTHNIVPDRPRDTRPPNFSAPPLALTCTYRGEPESFLWLTRWFTVSPTLLLP